MSAPKLFSTVVNRYMRRIPIQLQRQSQISQKGDGCCSFNTWRNFSSFPVISSTLSFQEKFIETFTRYKFLQAENLLTPEEELQAYSYFKQAINGQNQTPMPPDSHLDAKEKWEAWFQLGNMTPEEAQENYMNFVNKIQARFAEDHLSRATN